MTRRLCRSLLLVLLCADAVGVATAQLRPLGWAKERIEDDTYKEWWGNGLHPTEQGVGAVAGRFHEVLGAYRES